MREFFREIVHALEEGRPVELVSIAASDGSTPRSLTREQYAMFQRWSTLTDEQKELILKLIENMK